MVARAKYACAIIELNGMCAVRMRSQRALWNVRGTHAQSKSFVECARYACAIKELYGSTHVQSMNIGCHYSMTTVVCNYTRRHIFLCVNFMKLVKICTGIIVRNVIFKVVLINISHDLVTEEKRKIF